MVTTILRWLRHGPFKKLSPFWVLLGNMYQKIIAYFPSLSTQQYINTYGPFKLDAKFAFSNFKNWGAGHNEGFKQCIEDCRGQQCVIDVGAHIGLVSLPMSQVVNGTVYAFEPAKANRQHLLSHIKRNHITNISVQDCLVGREALKQVDFFEQDGATGMNSRVIKKEAHLYHKTVHAQTSLDIFCFEKKLLPQVIKIDVEGAEYDVILGAHEILSTYRPIVYLSIHPKELSLMGQSVEDLIHLLAELGYHAYAQDGTIMKDFGLSEYRFIKRNVHD